MADDIRADRDRDPKANDETALSARLQSLGKRLGDHHPGSDRDPVVRPTSDPSAIARGFRLSTELVAGVLVGAAIGWGLDRLLGISPWGMIVFLLLGFAAGVLNVARTAGGGRQKSLGPPRSGGLTTGPGRMEK